MIDPILSITPTIAGDIPPFTIVQMWDAELSTSRMVMCKGHTDTWSVFAYDNGYTFRMLKSDTLDIVTGVSNWDSLSQDERMDIELALMTRGL